MHLTFHLLVLKWTTPQFEYLQISVSEHQLFARTTACAEQRLLLMAITVSLAVVVLVVTAPQSDQRSALPCIHVFWHAFYS